MNWEKIAKEKDDGTFTMYGMKKYLSECSSLYPLMHTDSINYIVEIFLEFIDDVDFHTWLKKGNDSGRPIIITKEMLQKDFKDLLVVSEDLEVIRDLFMYLYDVEMWIDDEIECLYTTMFNISYENRTKLNYTGIAMEFERLCTLQEREIADWKDINTFIECIDYYGYDMETDYNYRTDKINTTIDNIIERMQQVFPRL